MLSQTIYAPTQELITGTTNLSLGYNQVYYVLKIAILEMAWRNFSVSQNVLKAEDIKTIINISWVKSYNHPKTVPNIHNSFNFKLYNFRPKNCQIRKFCIISSILIHSRFVQLSINFDEKKLDNLVLLLYNSCLSDII